jgi:hypothetical protein
MTARRLGVWLSATAVLFLVFDSTGKLLEVAPVVAGAKELGYPEDIVRTLGIILLLSTALYVTPRVSVVGALLLTAYLGGAVATHARVGSPLLTHTLFPVYLSAFLWGGLLLRRDRLREALFRAA